VRRSLLDPIREDLEERMVFLSGPRQVGKTSLARSVLEEVSPGNRVYLNWDHPRDRATIRKLAWDRTAPVAVLDEVHKYPRWKRLVKGFHDLEGKRQRLLVTGSARLDVYRRGGDSLFGRYARQRLHPLTVGEIVREGKPPSRSVLLDPGAWATASAPAPAEVLQGLLSLGGFPEPFLRGSARFAGRWRLLRRDLLLRQDLRDLTQVRDLAGVEYLHDRVLERVGSPLSLNSLREDLEVDHKTVKHWVDVLERLFLVFRVRPHAGSLARTLRKEAKVYSYDWSDAPEGGARFESLVGSHLLKLCHWLADVEGVRVDLHYVRDREKREVDFLLVKERKPWVLVEAKVSDQSPSPALAYFRSRLGVPFAFQVVAQGEARRDVVPAGRFLAGLP
jgi:predicted AAA+ superfamily ATPase